MRKYILRLLLGAMAAAVIYSSAASADCVLPAPPSHVPDGESANEQEMMAAMQTLKKYNADVTEYTQCLEFEQRRSLISTADQEHHRNLAVDALASVAARFNEQVRRFKARHT
jgi:hypothetical protein